MKNINDRFIILKNWLTTVKKIYISYVMVVNFKDTLLKKKESLTLLFGSLKEI